jgi:molybdopterin converting factor small subunit
MTSKVLFFSLLRDVVGADEIEWAVPAGGLAVADILGQLYAEWPALREWDTKILVAVDLEYVGRDVVVMPGQELAVMPPVQGG